MDTNDQWFEPGDKVMRVALASLLGLPVTDLGPQRETDFGRVLCVERCWRVAGQNWVTFVGVPNGPNEAWYACCFRKVSEIKLCVSAVNRKREPNELQNV